ncbi:exodeoxyribonuclease 7 large subunit [Striga asiatica]|uniref:Exodeoxyribonuclease 7 large subunit n=1 Tax=Striga asiatica TaxID=4170 RepID=A0A5A7P4V4_STRAF|nr:exodeoxyribonuclease 7 large subunit [Striga asiatica]
MFFTHKSPDTAVLAARRHQVHCCRRKKHPETTSCSLLDLIADEIQVVDGGSVGTLEAVESGGPVVAKEIEGATEDEDVDRVTEMVDHHGGCDDGNWCCN